MSNKTLVSVQNSKIMQACTKCGVYKELEGFPPNRRRKLGRQSACRECCREGMRMYRTEHPEETKQVALKRYDLSLEDYKGMLDRQEGCCAICSTSMGTPNVDHCHETGRIRGLLCTQCNQGLGRFKDCIPFLEKAIEYLKQS